MLIRMTMSRTTLREPKVTYGVLVGNEYVVFCTSCMCYLSSSADRTVRYIAVRLNIDARRYNNGLKLPRQSSYLRILFLKRSMTCAT